MSQVELKGCQETREEDTLEIPENVKMLANRILHRSHPRLVISFISTIKKGAEHCREAV